MDPIIKRSVIIILLFSIVACQSSKKEKAKLFYDRIHHYLDMAERPLNLLGDSTIAIHQHLINDPGYLADTARMKELIRSAAEINTAIVDSINKMEDPEPAIGVKQAALNYTLLWENVLKNEYQLWLKELPMQMNEKTVYFQKLLEPALKNVQDASDVLTVKNRSFRETYDF